LSLLAERGVRCGLIAVEESKEKVGRNYLSQYSGVENSRVRSATLGEEEWNAVLSARESAGRLPIIVTDEPQTCEQAVAAIETMANEYQCGVIAVDHIQRLSLRGNWTGRKVEEVTRMSMMLTSAFKRQGVCGIIVSQLNRPEQKHVEPPPPQMADLRESGAIEQDADAILLLHRSDYYHKGDSRWTPTGKMKVVIAKSRDGKTGWLTLKDELKYQRFADLSQTEQMIAGAAGDSDGEDVPNFK
jgi:replicative DNA helicase